MIVIPLTKAPAAVTHLINLGREIARGKTGLRTDILLRLDWELGEEPDSPENYEYLLYTGIRSNVTEPSSGYTLIITDDLIIFPDRDTADYAVRRFAANFLGAISISPYLDEEGSNGK